MSIMRKSTLYIINKVFKLPSSFTILKPNLNANIRNFKLNCSLYTTASSPCKYDPILQGKSSNLYNIYYKRSCLDIMYKSKFEIIPDHSKKMIATTSVIWNGKYKSSKQSYSKHQRSTVYYIISIVVLVTGMSYAAVPLYRIFCQAYSYGGTTKQDLLNTSKIQTMHKIKNRQLKIKFNADTASSMRWNFKPQQSEISLIPGETALAFYSARNPTDESVVGVSTYNVIPFEAGQYFNKIQCFCFEEQMLNPNEEVSMPVFFYIDPEFHDDPKMELVDDITLSYTFFEVKDTSNIPLPGFMKHK